MGILVLRKASLPVAGIKKKITLSPNSSVTFDTFRQIKNKSQWAAIRV